MLDGATLSGDIDGGGGSNTLDYRDYSTAILVDLSSYSATGISRSIVGIHNVYGGSGDDLIIGDSGDNILGSSGGNDILNGLLGNNTYRFFDGFEQVTIIHASAETLDFSNVTSALTFNPAAGLVTGPAGSLVNYDYMLVKSYIGGADSDLFIFPDGFILPDGTIISGGPGGGTIDLSAHLLQTDLLLTGTGDSGFNGRQAAIPGGFTNITAVIGSVANSDNNKLSGANLDSLYSFAAGGYKVTTNAQELSFVNFGLISGGNADDTFAFSGDVNYDGLVDGGGGSNWLDYSAYGAPVSVNLTTGSATAVSLGMINTVKQILNIIGSPGDDHLVGSSAGNIFSGGGGNDYLEGKGGFNTYLFRDSWGHDIVVNSSGQGRLDFSGTSENLAFDLAGSLASTSGGLNTVNYSGISRILGGTGANHFTVTGNHGLYLDGGSGSSTLDYSQFSGPVSFNLQTGSAAGISGFSNMSSLVGSSYSDTLVGPNQAARFNIDGVNIGDITWTAGDAVVVIAFAAVENLRGGAGDDQFTFIDSGAVSGSIAGVAGSDWIDYSLFDSNVIVDLATGNATAVGGPISGILNIIGSPYDDYLSGNNQDNIISGGAGNDIIYGIGGSNVLNGGSGNDEIYGGSGNDRFTFDDEWGIDLVVVGGGLNVIDFSLVGADLLIILGENGLPDSLITISEEANQLLLTPNGIRSIYAGSGDNLFNLSGSYPIDLFGGSGDDLFTLTDELVYAGLIDGQGGKNTLDLNAYSTARAVALTGAGSSSGFDGLEESLAKGFKNITHVEAGGSGNTIKAVDGPGTFVLDGSPRFEAAGQSIAFAGFSELIGGSAGTAFVIEGPQTFDLTGGSGADSFIFKVGSRLIGTVDGSGGANLIDLSALGQKVVITLSNAAEDSGFDGSAVSVDGQVILFRNISAYQGTNLGDSLVAVDAPSTYILGQETRYESGGKSLVFSRVTELVGAENSVTRFEIYGEQVFRLLGGLDDGAQSIFVFADQASLIGVIYGRDSYSTLDYSDWTEALEFLITGIGDGRGISGRSETVPLGFRNINLIIGGSSEADVLVGMDVRSNWELTGGGTVLYNGAEFALQQVEILAGSDRGDTFIVTAPEDNPAPFSIAGSSGNDQFRFEGSGSLTGIIDGRAGVNTLDYSDYDQGVTFNLNLMNATGLGGFTNIAQLVGSDYDDTLIGSDSGTLFRITESNAGDVSFENSHNDNLNTLEITFTAIENLVGGEGDDTFAFYAQSDFTGELYHGAVSGIIDGGDGSDWLNYTHYLISGVSVNLAAGSATGVGDGAEGMLLNFNNIKGSPLDDQFIGNDTDNIFDGGEGSDHFVGGGGVNTYRFYGVFGIDNLVEGSGSDRLDFSKAGGVVVFDLTAGRAQRSGGSATFSGINLIIGSNAGNSFVLNGGALTIDLVGGAGDDTFFLNNGAVISGTIDGGCGSNILDYSGYGEAVTVNLTLAEATGINGYTNITDFRGSSHQDTLIGPVSGRNYLIDGNSSGRITDPASIETEEIAFHSFEIIVGGAGDDYFIFIGSGSIDGQIDGGAGANWLDYSSYSDDVIVNLAEGSATAVGNAHAGRLSNINHLVGSPQQNTIVGNGTDNIYRPVSGGSGSFDGSAGKNILDYSLYSGPVVINLEQSSASGLDSFVNLAIIIGREESGDLLIGPDSGAEYIFADPQSGRVRWVAGGLPLEITFSRIEGITGGSGGDRFSFTAAGAFSGLIDGGAGYDILDYSSYGAPVTFDLEQMTASGLGDFSGMERIIGSIHSDLLIGPDSDAVFTINSRNGGTIEWLQDSAAIELTFAAIENLRGGSGDDQFSFTTGGSLGGLLDGGAGNDILDYDSYGALVGFNLAQMSATGLGGFAGIEHLIGSAYSDTLVGPNSGTRFTVNGPESGSVSWQKDGLASELTFAAIENLRGSSGNDYFGFDGSGLLTGTINGGGGANWLDYSAYAGDIIVNLATGSATAVRGGAAGSVSNVLNVIGSAYNNVLTGNNSNNSFGFVDGGTYVINPGQGNNSLDLSALGGDLDVTLSGAGIVVPGITINFAPGYSLNSFVRVVGGAGSDIFRLLNGFSYAGVIEGGGGDDTLDYSSYNAPVVFNLTRINATGLGGFSGIEHLIGSAYADTLIGPNSDTVFMIDQPDGGAFKWQQDGLAVEISFAAIETLRGGSGNDTFEVHYAGTLSGTIDGGAGINIIDYSHYNPSTGDQGVTVNLASGQATNIGSDLDGMVANISSIIGSPYNDHLTGNSTANMIYGGSGNDQIYGVGGSNVISGGSGVNQLYGGSDNDTFIFGLDWETDTLQSGGGSDALDFTAIADSIIFTVWAGMIEASAGSRSLAAEAFGIALIISGAGDDRFSIADGVTYTGLFDGGAGSNLIDWSAFTTPIDVVLTNAGLLAGFDGYATNLPGGFRNIDRMLGGSAGDSIKGINTAGNFSLGEDGNVAYDARYSSSGKELFLTDFETYIGGTGSDTFVIYGDQTGNLYGSAGNDSFIFIDVATLQGLLDGGSGVNVLDYSDYSTTRNFYLTTAGSINGFDGGEASISGGFKNITTIIGSQATDSLSGLNSSAVWQIGQDQGVYNAVGRTVNFVSIENVIGGAAADSFKIVTGSALTGSVDGRSDTDTLDYAAYLPDLVVNLEATLADCINAGVSSIENVKGGKGSNHLIGDEKNNKLTGGPGYNILEGRGGDDILVTTGGYNILIGGDGYDTAIIAYNSRYEALFSDIEKWQFLQPSSEGAEWNFYYSTFIWPTLLPYTYSYSQSIDASKGGSISFRNIIVEIPPDALSGSVEITIKMLTLYEQYFLGDSLLRIRIISEVYQIFADRFVSLKNGQFAILKIIFNPAELFEGEEAVICVYDSLTNTWIELETSVEYDPDTGQYYAVAKINKLFGTFAVFRKHN